MKVLFEDNDIIVVIKPRGIASEGAAGCAVDLLCEQTGGEIFPVHRLDRETAGIMVFAKNRRSAAVLSEAVRDKRFVKKYYAVFAGSLEEKSGEMVDLLFRDKQKNKSFVVKRMRKGVKEAKLTYRVLGENSGLSLAEVLLGTGRTHQIRVQFASRKHPLFGDSKYGGAAGEFALFAHSLSFEHPKTREWLEFSELPDVNEYPWNLFEY